MATTRRIRTMTKGNLSPAWKYFLETGQYFKLREKFPDMSNLDHFNIFQLGHPTRGGNYWEKLRKIWLLHRDEILRIWKADRRRGKPWAEKVFTGEGR